jgi:hypothetical protein
MCEGHEAQFGEAEKLARHSVSEAIGGIFAARLYCAARRRTGGGEEKSGGVLTRVSHSGEEGGDAPD